MSSEEETLVEANPCKLRNGNWGAKTAEPVEVGATVQIVTRAGKKWQADITQVVWTDGTVCICETASAGSTDKSEHKPAQKKPAAKKPAKATPGTSDTADDPEAYGTPAYTADTPPTSVDAASDELDAMADRAAEGEHNDDDIMAAFDEFERSER